MKLEKYLKSKLNREIIRFFLENPSSIDTPRGIATWINENVGKTEAALKELAEAKILVPHGSKATSAYGYTTDSRMMAKIKTCLRKK
jgi:hypothetical protein